MFNKSKIDLWSNFGLNTLKQNFLNIKKNIMYSYKTDKIIKNKYNNSIKLNNFIAYAMEKTKMYVNNILNILSNYKFFNTNYDQISSMYFFFGLITGIVGILSTVYLKLSITKTFDIFTYYPEFYNIILTTHSIITLFFFSMAILICGFTYMLLPLLLKLKHSKIVFSKTSRFSFFLLVLSFLIFITVLILEVYFGEDWEIKIPFFDFFLEDTNLLLSSIYCFAISYFLTSIIFVITLYKQDLNKLPIFMLTIFVTSLLLLLFLPIFIGITTVYLIDFNWLTIFFNPVVGGDTLPWSNLLWFFAHPIVYILVLPSIGIISDIVFNLGKKSYSNNKYFICNI